MTYHWTEADIIPGRWVCKPPAYHYPDSEDCDWQVSGSTAKWTYLIGWQTARGTKGGNNYCLINPVDGMVCRLKSKAELVASLNKDGMRPMPHKWLLATIDHLRDCQVAT